jgi:L-ascorbate metabolism protein UlaG (beta-lactamase superfamily)
MRILVYSTLVFLVSFWLSDQEAYTQLYNFTEIRENLLMHRPQTGDPEIRKNSICSIDELVLGSYNQQHEQIYEFYRLMLEKAMMEIKTEKVEAGASVWQIYNHGFIVKTPSVLLGFDLYDYYGSANLKELAYSLDVLFITHNHTDHLSPELEQAMVNLDKPVIRYVNPAMSHVSTSINVGDSINELYLLVTQHTGLHTGIAIQMFEVVTPEGIRIFHTGDNQTSETLPVIEDVDILLLNAWVNESGWTSSIEGSRNAINKIKPVVTLPGHILELGHVMAGTYSVPYSDVFMVNDIDLGCEYHVLAWGERYHFDNTSNDSIRPNPVIDPQTQITNDSIIISWDLPAIAKDGESASFYRIIRKGSGEFFTKNRRISFEWDTIGSYQVKIFSYDNCGNQSSVPVEINVTVPDVNYAPRIVNYNPSSVDTTDVFSGVYKVFTVGASDPNNYLLTYSWEFDGNKAQDGPVPYFIYNYNRLDTGFHWLTVSVSDQNLSRQHTWYLDHHNLMAIIDDSDTLMYSEFGNWNNYSNSTAHNGSLRFSYLTNIGAWASYTYYPEIQGYYNTYAFIPDVQNGSSYAVYYLLIDQQSVDTIIHDQGTGRGQWLELGQYFLPDSTEVQIRVVNTGRAKKGVSLLADAVRLIHVEGPSAIEVSKYNIPIGYSTLRCFPNPFSESTMIILDNTLGCSYTLKIINLAGMLVRMEENISVREYILERKGLKEGCYLIELNGPINYRGKIVIQ